VSGPVSESVVTTLTVRGRCFDITVLTWADTDELSYDVTDSVTGARLHDESFDTAPTHAEVVRLLDQVGQDLVAATLCEVLVPDVEALTRVIDVTRTPRSDHSPAAASSVDQGATGHARVEAKATTGPVEAVLSAISGGCPTLSASRSPVATRTSSATS